MTLKSEAKFKGKQTCGLKNDIKNLVNFHTSNRKFENLHSEWLLLPNTYKVFNDMRNLVSFNARSDIMCILCVGSILCGGIMWKRRELCIISLKNDAKFEEKMTRALKNDIRNLTSFDPALEKNLHFMASFWLKCITFELK